MRLPRRLAHGETAELVDHLGELRTRLIASLAALAATSSVAYVFHERIVQWLNATLPAGHPQPITLSIGEPFMTSLKVSVYAGFFLALPIILWQFWSFVAPALERRTQRAIAGFVVFAAVLLAAGLAFGYSVALPAATHFLTDFDSDVYNNQLRASTYYSFVLLVLLSVGLVFELPIFILALVRLGVTSSRRLRKNRRLGYVIVTAVAVALPGVDPMTTLFELLPLLVLFEASIWLSVLFERRWRQLETATGYAS